MGLVALSLGAAGTPQPAGPTRGIRKAYKVLGLLDDCSGRLCSTAPPGWLTSASYAAFGLAVLSHTTQHGLVMQEGGRDHTRKATEELFAAQATRLTKVPWPAYAPDVHPIAYLWKKVTKMAMHLKPFPDFTLLQAEVDKALRHFAQTPHAIMTWMTRYCDSLGMWAA